MSLSTADRTTAARELARQMFHAVNKTANLDLDDLVAAVGAIDDEMDALASTLTQATTVKANLIQTLPEPFASNSNAQEKALALMVWAMKETGII